MSNGFLSQEEIDALLNGDIEASKENVDIEILTDIEKDLLGEIGNISMGSASTALYQLVNQQVNITTPVVSITTLRDIKKEFEYPNIILDVEYTEGIVGRNILIMKVADAGVIANLMMGGDGNVQSAELSEIEISAVQEAMNQMIGSSATSMATMFARIVNISPPNSKIWSEISETISDTLDEDEQIVRVKFNITIGTLVDSEIMQILPIETAKKIVSIMMGEEKNEEPVVEKPVVEVNNYKVEEKTISYESQAEVQREPERAPQREVKAVEVHEAKFGQLTPSRIGEPHKNIDLILDVPLNISVVLGRTKKSVKDILNLSTGSLIELDKLAEEPVEILVNGKKIAYGEVVVVDENFGVRITNIVSGVDRIKSLK
ncbi:flagellar motor switch phosphatase FliY [Clostridium gasigenes]|uniref:flagellar motor switch phosphatase FliY n=1 Tax=Clostridium gasigenes TaxID=94869 RepID=UPI001C0D1204|nr:flagellar motor switch phosphatase FliY [Clostridium gasigenes]MBU3105527.1 flagellar motor switch phosphatase FliY [Clostridium gasigenes]MBU3132181.1 flagellar motor switch phosphatase FliY [Clostridium gasigenes]